MSSSKQPDEFTRKRQAQERKLIDDIKYKRSCVKLASTYPSEEEIQKKIRRLVKSVLLIVKSNSLSGTFAELRGTKPRLFASMEATLYKSRLEKLHLEACFMCEKIHSTAEALSMAYEVYGLLVLSDDKVADSRSSFYDKEEQDVAREPDFTADFIRKELDFLADLKHQIEHEIREAQLQEECEKHANPLDSVMELLTNLRKEHGEQYMELLRTIDSQNDSIKEMSERLDVLTASVTRIQGNQEHLESLLPKGEVGTMQEERESIEKEPSEHADEPAERDTASEEPQEDLLDLMEDYDFEVGQDDAGSDRSERRSPEPIKYPGSQARIGLEQRMAGLRAFLNENRTVPERNIRQVDNMRDKDRFPICSFCLIKGTHYSDSCPKYACVEKRFPRARCKYCSDSRHYKEFCPNERKPCMYCGSNRHNKSLCKLPEEIADAYKELEEIKQELETNEDYYGPASTSRP